MTLEEIRDRLKPYNIKEVSREIGISYITLWRISNGTNTNPQVDTYFKIVNFLEKGK